MFLSGLLFLVQECFDEGVSAVGQRRHEDIRVDLLAGIRVNELE